MSPRPAIPASPLRSAGRRAAASTRPSKPVPSADSSAHFRELVDRVAPAVEKRLVHFFEKKLRPLSGDRAVLARSVENLTLRGGKRLRAALAVAGYEVTTGKRAPSSLLEAGVALELLQSYFLIHDDWMDGDELRRGKPAVHALLREHYGSVFLGDRAGILAGDLAVAWAQEALVTAAPPLPLAAFDAFTAMQQDAVFGQHLDLLASPDGTERTYELKTSSYTVAGPLRLGALWANAPEETLLVLERYAMPVGVAFQLRDDLLGAFALPSQTGKPRGSDLREGKETLLVALARTALTGADRRRFTKLFGKQRATDAELEALIDLILSTSAPQQVEERIAELVAEAQGVVTSSHLPLRGKRLLLGAAELLTRRKD